MFIFSIFQPSPPNFIELSKLPFTRILKVIESDVFPDIRDIASADHFITLHLIIETYSILETQGWCLCLGLGLIVDDGDDFWKIDDDGVFLVGVLWFEDWWVFFDLKMAHSLQRIWSDGGAMRGTVCPLSRPLSSAALVQLKPGEIGLVFEIPEEHLRRRVVIYSARI
ncbi:hypothetical protein Dsin_013079 [Dipteronia sinensis]|uniref:Uncharacterized protein n=1 Tax=Dipteronia sinensis TaxID=43782 RepID=A0AAE0AKI4_9ROSI|nr:hypothetical protein Dsin_013079 [Dipteronia sinensis]